MRMKNSPEKKLKADSVEAPDSPAEHGDAEKNRCEGELPISPKLDRWIRQQGRDLRLRQVDRQLAVKVVNDLVKELQKFMKDNTDQPFFRDISQLNTGSYYELVKITKPNEFDIMLKLKIPRIKWTELEEHKGLFYTIALFRPTRSEIRHFLLEDELTISASKLMKEIHQLIKKFVSTYQVSAGEGRWMVCRKKINSPAVTLAFMDKDKKTEILSVDIVPALEVPQGWPEAARAGPPVDKWLGKNARRRFVSQPVYFVPKRPKARNLKDAEKESWRISFSHIEKEIIRFHGNKKTCCESKENECCRKLCLRLLKCLFEGLKKTYPKELEPLCSYHGKTAFFHTLSARCEDTLWTPGQLSDCFIKLLGEFEKAVRLGSLPHFFVPKYNLFSRTAFPARSLQFLANALQNQRENGLPLLQVQRSAPALCYTPAPPELEISTDALAAQQHKSVTDQTNSCTKTYLTLTCIFVFLAIGCVLYA
ncbi:cyclic GMP-AMP synthase isoform X2 [Hoplias malabaricus]|uniref:cyclic GMP-AMP synthase isoform X2 n=1 Tax=Hoplias malabaricus TaxID=27720 RepID=UPI003462B4BB